MKSTRLPLCEPPPSIDFKDKRFCLTGTFNFGTRRDCETAIADRGGSSGALAKSIDYLVIGSYVTAAWKQEKFGRKIEKAIALREAHGQICIVSELAWERAMRGVGFA